MMGRFLDSTECWIHLNLGNSILCSLNSSCCYCFKSLPLVRLENRSVYSYLLHYPNHLVQKLATRAYYYLLTSVPKLAAFLTFDLIYEQDRNNETSFNPAIESCCYSQEEIQYCPTSKASELNVIHP